MTPLQIARSCQLDAHRRTLIVDPPRVVPDGGVLFRPSWSLGVPTKAGVYLIHDLRGILYVGRADQLRRRFEEHYLDSHNPALRTAIRTAVGQLMFSWVLVAAPEQFELERDLIRSFRPLCNVQHNSVSAERCA